MIPYFVGTWGSRSLSLNNNTVSGNVITIRDSVDEYVAQISYGAGFQYGLFDVKYMVSPTSGKGLAAFEAHRVSLGVTKWIAFK